MKNPEIMLAVENLMPASVNLDILGKMVNVRQECQIVLLELFIMLMIHAVQTLSKISFLSALLSMLMEKGMGRLWL